jgi:hypothetical protein
VDLGYDIPTCVLQYYTADDARAGMELLAYICEAREQFAPATLQFYNPSNLYCVVRVLRLIENMMLLI